MKYKEVFDARGLRKTELLVILILLLALACSTWAEVCKGSKAPKAELAADDGWADLASADSSMGTADAPDRGGKVGEREAGVQKLLLR